MWFYNETEVKWPNNKIVPCFTVAFTKLLLLVLLGCLIIVIPPYFHFMNEISRANKHDYCHAVLPPETRRRQATNTQVYSTIAHRYTSTLVFSKVQELS